MRGQKKRDEPAVCWRGGRKRENTARGRRWSEEAMKLQRMQSGKTQSGEKETQGGEIND